MSLSNIQAYLTNVFRTTNDRSRNSTVQLNIVKTEALTVKSKLFKARSKAIHIDEDTRCDVCHAKIGDMYRVIYSLY